MNIRQVDGPPSLITYQQSIEVYDSMRDYHQSRTASETAHGAMGSNVASEGTSCDIINSILPPRDWHDHNNKLRIQYVSHEPASRADVKLLTEKLQKFIHDRQARLTGICSIRSELYSQIFDELIRQVTVDCPERGVLLMRVRDQRKMTMAAYETVYQSSVTFGMRKQVESEDLYGDIEVEYVQLLKKKQELEIKKDILLARSEILERELREERQFDRERREEELTFLKNQEDNLQKFLHTVRTDAKEQF